MIETHVYYSCSVCPHLQRLVQHTHDVVEVPQHSVGGDVPLPAYHEAILGRPDLRRQEYATSSGDGGFDDDDDGRANAIR